MSSIDESDVQDDGYIGYIVEEDPSSGVAVVSGSGGNIVVWDMIA